MLKCLILAVIPSMASSIFSISSSRARSLFRFKFSLSSFLSPSFFLRGISRCFSCRRFFGFVQLEVTLGRLGRALSTFLILVQVLPFSVESVSVRFWTPSQALSSSLSDPDRESRSDSDSSATSALKTFLRLLLSWCLFWPPEPLLG